MLTHVVMFKLKHPEPGQAAALRDALLALEGEVPSLLRMEAGADILHEDRSYDVVLIARFNDLAGLEAYQGHPAHQKVATIIREVAASVIAVDYVEGGV